MNAQRGFTFIELLLSMVIASIMTVAMTSVFVGWYTQSRLITANLEVLRIELAAQAYTSSHNGTLPQDMTQLQPVIFGPIRGSYSFDNNTLTGANYTGLVWHTEQQQWGR